MRTVLSRTLFGVLGLTLALGGGGLVSPAFAGAEATPGPAPIPGPSGLPDGRVYEEVSPADKNGNYVASGGTLVVTGQGYAAAEANGNGLVFLGSGAMGEAASSLLQPYVAHRTPGVGWSTESAVPAQTGVEDVQGGPNALLFSSELTRFAFQAAAQYSREQPPSVGDSGGSVNIYLSENPFASPVWLAKPATTETVPRLGENTSNCDYYLAGGSSSLSTVYFVYTGTLLAEDASRIPNIGEGIGGSTKPWGFYEWSDGQLADAGVLPDGTVSPWGAMPAAFAGDIGFNREACGHHFQTGNFDNQVADEGSRVFFVSPDPDASTVSGCGPATQCTSAPPELYVRETLAGGSKRTVLVSRSELPGHVDEPAPTGPVSVVEPIISAEAHEDSTDAYASRDGSRVFFASPDRLTEQAPEGREVKEYEFDVDSETLTYLPGVVGPIVAAAQDGSDFLFENTAGSPAELELWQDTGGGGQVTKVAQLPEPEEQEPFGEEINVEARASSDGSAFVVDTNAPIPGFNDGLGYGEVYRYEPASNALTCLSCAPAGVSPAGNSNISYDDRGAYGFDRPTSDEDTRVISADGSRIFFDTPNPLVPQATDGKRNVYEWEDGEVYLLSSGTSDEDSFYLDSSESGGDVFFNTTSGLVSGDTDGAYDAYDARIPRPGDNPPPTAVPCQGDVCQGPPSVPQLLGAPPSATFNGLGNVTPSEPAPSKTKTKVKAKTKGKKKAKRHAKSRRRGRRRLAVAGRRVAKGRRVLRRGQSSLGGSR